MLSAESPETFVQPIDRRMATYETATSSVLGPTLGLLRRRRSTVGAPARLVFNNDSLSQPLGRGIFQQGVAAAFLRAVLDLSSENTALKPRAASMKSSSANHLVRDLGWDRKKADRVRQSLSSFEEDWNDPGMEAYDRL